MDKKRVILAIALSVVVVVVWAFLVSPQLVPAVPPEVVSANEESRDGELFPDSNRTIENTGSSTSDKGVGSNADNSISGVMPLENENLREDDFTFETDKFEIVFASRGGLIKSLKLKATPEINNTEVNMILNGDTGVYPFSISNQLFSPDNLAFEVTIEENKVSFSRILKMIDGENESEFLFLKQYLFYNNEYLFDFSVIMEQLDFETRFLYPQVVDYTLEFGPQIGPEFKKLDKTTDYRWLTYYDGAKRKDFSNKVKKSSKMIDDSARWIAVEGKYFIAICYPPKEFLDPGTLGFDATPMDNFPDVATMVFKRPLERRAAAIEDKYQFYIGPKKKEILNQYSNKSFDQAVKVPFLNWLGEILKMVLLFLQNIVGNWGVAIILMTLIIKLLLFPLTQKSFRSNSKMQALAPKMNEIKAKYKDDPQKMQTETAALYKKEGINPVGGCLPLLIQMPIFIALYGLLNTHFELRGAVFIPGWIDDLSLPETFISLPDAFSGIPVIGNQLRLLPFLMVGMTFLQQKFSQNPSATTGQMKMMMYAMPLVFFVIMYNMPAGLVVYWTVQNLLSIFQQIYINKLMKKEKTDAGGFMDKVKQMMRRK